MLARTDVKETLNCSYNLWRIFITSWRCVLSSTICTVFLPLDWANSRLKAISLLCTDIFSDKFKSWKKIKPSALKLLKKINFLRIQRCPGLWNFGTKPMLYLVNTSPVNLWSPFIFNPRSLRVLTQSSLPRTREFSWPATNTFGLWAGGARSSFAPKGRWEYGGGFGWKWLFRSCADSHSRPHQGSAKVLCWDLVSFLFQQVVAYICKHYWTMANL